MKIRSVRSRADRISLQAFFRQFIPPSDKAEMICQALNSDAQFVRVAVDERGVAGAIAYDIDHNIYVYALGSIRPGVGTALMGVVDREARKRLLPIHLAATRSAIPFYQRLGFDIERVDLGGSVIDMVKPEQPC